MKVATAKYKPDNAQVLALSDLKPLTKVFDPAFLGAVKESIEKQGLEYPLIVHQVEWEEWKREWEKEPIINFPPLGGKPGDIYYRIQCGCNRYVALEELGYTHVECAVVENRREAEELCKKLRKDKRWRKW